MLAASVRSGSRPFWHRPAPLTSVLEVDPGHDALRATFPASWRHLVRAKALLDCVTHLDVPAAFDEAEADRWARRLLEAVARELDAFGSAQELAGSPLVGAQARALAETTAGYAGTGVWQHHTVGAPSGGDPWVYCGPLSTWPRRDTRMPFALLVCAPEPALQRIVDDVGAALPTIGRAVAGVLRRPVVTVVDRPGGMYPLRLLLAGGESALGHKNFAHFVPLETPSASVAASPFTVVFANVHRVRLARCSLPLLEAATGWRATPEPDAVLAAALAWFRCHDLGHLWRARGNSAPAPDGAGTNGLERMVLEEAYADVLGLVCATALWEPQDVGAAFCAELVRYLSRDLATFADTKAAAIELGWLTLHGIKPAPLDAGTVLEMTSCLGTLAPTLHDMLWGGDAADTAILERALAEGRRELERFAALYEAIPTDLTYAFG